MTEQKMIDRINEIADEYQERVEDAYGAYVDFSKVKRMNENVMLLSDEAWLAMNGPDDAKAHCARCDYDADIIYISQEQFQGLSLKEQIHHFVHEYIHRIARYQDESGKWYSGLENKNGYIGISEVLTEYYTSGVVGPIETNSYSIMFDVLRIIRSYLHNVILSECYFANDVKKFNQLLYPYGEKIADEFDILLCCERSEKPEQFPELYTDFIKWLEELL